MYLTGLTLVAILAVFLTGYGLNAFARRRLYRGVLAFALGSNVVMAAVLLFYDAFVIA